jgi:hypothetical protein
VEALRGLSSFCDLQTANRKLAFSLREGVLLKDEGALSLTPGPLVHYEGTLPPRTETSIVIPDGVEDPREHLYGESPDRVIIDNRSGLPNATVEAAVSDYFVENASLAWGHETNFQTYANEGSLLARRQFRTPANVLDEIKLARDLADRDDDIAATIGQILALAFEGGMENQHADEKTVALFNEIAKNMDLDLAMMELMRELLISSQINSATLFTRENLEFTLEGSEKIIEESVAAPLLGVLPAENIRVIGNDMFRTGTLAYCPDNERLRMWLEEFFAERTTAARKAEMGRKDRVSAALFQGVIELSAEEMLDTSELPAWGGRLYLLNPRMVQRTTFPKGSAKYPRPLLTRNFALLEAKRLLNIMDYALLQGGSNFIVVAKKGSDKLPAQPEEMTNLQQVVRRASKTGIIVGDHRLDFDIITPDLKELLNPTKRRMVGRKLAMAMLRLTEHGDEEGGSEGIKADSETIARVVMSDRRLVIRHVEKHAYDQTVRRNKSTFPKGHPSIWVPKIVLQGTNFFTDYILKLRDRGDIPRKWAVDAAGFDYEAGLQQRKREMERGDDDTLMPAAVPHSSPEMGPQDNNQGRPSGSRDGRPTNDPARPTRRITRVAGETVRAWYEGEPFNQVVRMGESTFALLEQYPERTIGRVTGIEREVLDAENEEAVRRGATLYIPVNPAYETREEKAVRLTDGISVIVGQRPGNDAIVAKLLCFREPAVNAEQAEEYALRWGFPVSLPEDSEEEAAERMPPVNVHITLPEMPTPGNGLEALASAMASAAASSQVPEIHIHPPAPEPEKED